MSPQQIGTLLEHAVLTVLYLSAPMLLAGLVVGLLVSLVQAVTQINEVTLVFIPKMLAVGAGLWLAGPWMFDRFQLYWREVLASIQLVLTGGL